MTISKPKAALALIFSPPVRTSTAGRAPAGTPVRGLVYASTLHVLAAHRLNIAWPRSATRTRSGRS